jgi:hypothetical protein
MKLTRSNFFTVLILIISVLCLSAVTAVAQKRVTVGATPVQQPVFAEYRGITIGMTAAEVRAKLGDPALKGDDQDYYVISQNEAAQIVYDAAHKTRVISVDYMGGVGAPDPKIVVGGDLQTSEHGLYKAVRNESLRLWVSYNLREGTVPVVTITIQRM